MPDPLPDVALDRLFRDGRSYNGYLEQPVAAEQLHAIWDLMKFGPTSANALPARMVWVTSADAKARLAAHASDTNKAKIMSAPVSVIIGMDMQFHDHLPDLFPHADARSWFVGNDAMIAATAIRNSSLQGAYLIMAARALGLDTGPMSGFDNAGVDAEFFAGTDVKSNFLTTLGYGDPASVFGRSPRPPFERFNRVL